MSDRPERLCIDARNGLPRFSMNLLVRRMSLCGAVLLFTACMLTPKQEPDAELAALAGKPVPPEQAGRILEEAGGNFVYGHGLGEAALTVGSVLLFPPYALYVLGNGALSLSGYEPLEITKALPKEERQEWNAVYDAVTAMPGEAAAAVAGESFREREEVRSRTKAMLREVHESEDVGAETMKGAK